MVCRAAREWRQRRTTGSDRDRAHNPVDRDQQHRRPSSRRTSARAQTDPAQCRVPASSSGCQDRRGALDARADAASVGDSEIGGGNHVRRCSAAPTMAAANGCSLPRSTAAARRNTSTSVHSAAIDAVWTAFGHRRSCRRRGVSPRDTTRRLGIPDQHPLCAPLPVPTAIASASRGQARRGMRQSAPRPR